MKLFGLIFTLDYRATFEVRMRVLLFREKALKNFGYNISFIV